MIKRSLTLLLFSLAALSLILSCQKASPLIEQREFAEVTAVISTTTPKPTETMSLELESSIKNIPISYDLTIIRKSGSGSVLVGKEVLDYYSHSSTFLDSESVAFSFEKALDVFEVQLVIDQVETFEYTIRVLEQDPPKIVMDELITVSENQSVIATINATDANGDDLIYAVSGTDSSAVTVNKSTGLLSFISEPDYESKTSYSLQLSVSDPVATVTQALSVLIADINEVPVITTSASVTAFEGQLSVMTVAATDEENDTLVYSLSQSDIFEINSGTGELSFSQLPDFESDDSSYSLTVYVSDGSNIASQALTVLLRDVNEAPAIDIDALYIINENQAFTVTASATDSEGDTLEFSLSGDDAEDFSIDSETGVIEMSVNPDYENQTLHKIVVEVSDGTTISTQSVSIAVENVNEPPVFLSSDTVSVREGERAVQTVQAEDPEGVTLEYILSGTDSQSFSLDTDSGELMFKSTPNYETDAVTYEITISVSDGVTEVDQEILVALFGSNDSPVITSTSSVTVSENQTAVLTVTATDEENDSLAFSLSGTDASAFSIHNETGVITFDVAPDYETKSSYDLVVEVSDGTVTTVQNLSVGISDIVDEDADGVLDIYDFFPNDSSRHTVSFDISLSFSSSSSEETLSVLVEPSEEDIEYSLTINVQSDNDEISSTNILAETGDYSYELNTFSFSGSIITVNVQAGFMTVTESLTESQTFTFSYADNRVYVDSSAVGKGNGSSWIHAANKLSTAVAFATQNGIEEIWIAEGDYLESSDITLESDLSIYGGFSGSESVTSDRNLSESESELVLEGSTIQLNGVSDVLIDGLTVSAIRDGYASDVLRLVDIDAVILSNISIVNNSSNSGTDIKNVLYSDYQEGTLIIDDLSVQGVEITDSIIKISDSDSESEFYITNLDLRANNVEGTIFKVEDSGGVFNLDQLIIKTTESDGMLSVYGQSSDLVANLTELEVVDNTIETSIYIEDIEALNLSQANFESNETGTYEIGLLSAVDVQLSGVTVNGYNGDNCAVEIEAVTGEVDIDSLAIVNSTGKRGLCLSDFSSMASINNLRMLGNSISKRDTRFSKADATISNSLFVYHGETVFAAFNSSDILIEDSTYVSESGDFDNFYHIKSSSTISTQNITKILSLSNNKPEITSDTSVEVDENQVSVMTVTATDADDDSLSFSISGTDASDFSINSSTGLLTFDQAPNYEDQDEYSLTLSIFDGTDTVSEDLSITIVDLNDSPTISNESSVTVSENQRFVITVSAEDEDDDSLEMQALSGEDSDFFNLDLSTGELAFKLTPNYEEDEETYSVILSVSDGTVVSTQSLSIILDDINEYPIFLSSSSVTVSENQVDVLTVIATDEDEDDLSYSLSGTDSSDFDINESTGVLSFDDSPNYELKDSYSLTVIASDGEYSVEQALTVLISDLNDLPMIHTEESLSVSENQRAVAMISVTDEDSDTLSFEISGTDASDFSIHSSTGELTFVSTPNYEEENTYELTVSVSDETGSVSVDITISIIDLNESPLITNDGSITVSENETEVLTVSASDEDSDTLEYSLSGADSDLFSIGASTGEISFDSAPNYESDDLNYALILEVSDGTVVVTQSLSIELADVNEKPAITNDDEVAVSENQTAVMTATASDEDGDSVNYSLSGTDAASFSIGESTGIIVFDTAPDFETKDSYSVLLTVSDGELSSVESIVVTIADINDLPQITSVESLSVSENETAVLIVTAYDDDEDTLEFSVSGDDSDSFSINASSGALNFNTAPDYESSDLSYDLILEVGDGSSTVTQSLAVTVVDINEAPVITNDDSITVSENQTAVMTATASDVDGDSLTYSLSGTDASGFSIGESTGVITFDEAPNYEAKDSYSMIIEVSDSDLTSTQSLTVTVSDIIDEDSDGVLDVNDLFPNDSSRYTVTFNFTFTLESSNSEETLTVLIEPSSDDVEYNISFNVQSDNDGISSSLETAKTGDYSYEIDTFSFTGEFVTVSVDVDYSTVTDSYTDSQRYVTSYDDGRIYIDRDAIGKNNGSSWEHALSDINALEEAVESAVAYNVTEIWLADGDYEASTDVSYFDDLEIYGGFSGTETATENRDLETYTSSLKLRKAMLAMDTVANVVLDGMEILASGTSDPEDYGIYLNSASGVLIKNIDIVNNTNTARDEYLDAIYMVDTAGKVRIDGLSITGIDAEEKVIKIVDSAANADIRLTNIEILNTDNESVFVINGNSGSIIMDSVTLNANDSSGTYAALIQNNNDGAVIELSNITWIDNSATQGLNVSNSDSISLTNFSMTDESNDLNPLNFFEVNKVTITDMTVVNSDTPYIPIIRFHDVYDTVTVDGLVITDSTGVRPIRMDNITNEINLSGLRLTGNEFNSSNLLFNSTEASITDSIFEYHGKTFFGIDGSSDVTVSESTYVSESGDFSDISTVSSGGSFSQSNITETTTLE